MIDAYFHWIDVIWIPICYYAVHERHRWWSLGFAVCSIILTRSISEVMVYIGFSHGIMGLISMHVYMRGLLVSSFFYSLFVLYAHFSKNTENSIFLAACLSIFFMIFLFASLFMLL